MNGHTEIVAMLLQAKGIDVNQGVKSWCLLLPYPSPYPTTINPYYFRCGIFVLYP